MGGLLIWGTACRQLGSPVKLHLREKWAAFIASTHHTLGLITSVSVVIVVAVQLLSRGWLFVTPWTTAHQASLSFTISWSLLKHMPTESLMPSNHSSCVIGFSSCPKSFPASASFPTIWLFASGGQRIGALGLASVLPMNIQGWFPLGVVRGSTLIETTYPGQTL